MKKNKKESDSQLCLNHFVPPLRKYLNRKSAVHSRVFRRRHKRIKTLLIPCFNEIDERIEKYCAECLKQLHATLRRDVACEGHARVARQRLETHSRRFIAGKNRFVLPLERVSKWRDEEARQEMNRGCQGIRGRS